MSALRRSSAASAAYHCDVGCQFGVQRVKVGAQVLGLGIQLSQSLGRDSDRSAELVVAPRCIHKANSAACQPADASRARPGGSAALDLASGGRKASDAHPVLLHDGEDSSPIVS